MFYFVATVLLVAALCKADYQTQWFDRDNPSGYGDAETRDQVSKYMRNCPYPNGVQCQTTSGTAHHSTGEVFDPNCEVRRGLACLNKAQTDGYCLDYKVRYTCPSGNACANDNGGCSQKCHGCPHCPGYKRCSCYAGYHLLADGHTCSATNRCFVCQSYNSRECTQLSNTDVDGHTMTYPCRGYCYTAQDWDGNWHRGCGEYPPTGNAMLLTSERPWNMKPPYTPGHYTDCHPLLGSKGACRKPETKYWLCSGDLCNGNGGSHRLISGSGYMSSPHFTGPQSGPRQLNYMNNVNTYYVIRAPHHIKVTFQHFDVERHSTCYWDYLELRDGGSSSSRLMGRYCSYPGKTPPAVQCTSGNTLYVRFHSDYSVTGLGYKFRYEKC